MSTTVESGLPNDFLRWTLQDWRVNSTMDSRFVLVCFRAAQWAYTHWGVVGRLLCLPYRLMTSLFMSIELPCEATVGPRLRLHHPHGVVLNPAVRLGSDCVLRQHVTIGNTTRRDGVEKGVATIGDAVDFGAGCVVVGPIHVGDHARIGALSLVYSDVPAYAVVRGNPSQVIRVEAPTAGPEGHRA